jgi:hypothetical protein
MITLTIGILIISGWLVVVLLLCTLVRIGAIREREEYERLVATNEKTHAVPEWNFGASQARRPVTGDDAGQVQAESPEIYGPSGRETMP